MQLREHLSLARELQDIVLADLVLSLAFSLALIGGAKAVRGNEMVFLYLFPIALFAITISFVLHEMMHKFTAQKYGAVAAFRTSTIGLGITLISGMFGFLLGIPGATVIYTNTFTKNEEGVVSLAGPMTNFAIFLVFLAIHFLYFAGSSFALPTVGAGLHSYLASLVNLTLFISIILAFFNMLPVFPLDGSKVLRWNKPVYFAMVAVTFLMLFYVIGSGYLLFLLVFMLAIALIFSFMYRGFSL